MLREGNRIRGEKSQALNKIVQSCAKLLTAQYTNMQKPNL